MWSVWVGVISLLVVYVSHWLYRWSNPKCSGKLPPGSMGLPFIGETIQCIIPSKSLDIPPFIKKRLKKYGPLFRTSLVGRPVVVSSDPEFNYFIFQQEGKLVQRWYLDSFAKILGQDSTAVTTTAYIHKYIRNVVLNNLGTESLKEKLLPQLEDMASQKLKAWSKMSAAEVKSGTSSMIFDLTAKLLVSYDPEKSEENLGETFTNFLDCIMSFPLNVPGTTYHKCLKNQKKVVKMIRDMLEERRSASRENCTRDVLDQVVEDMKKETFLTDDFVIYMMFGLLLASFETISSTLTLAIMLLTDHPSVVEELRVEHDAILKNRENPDSGLSWKEYKSMTFTQNVISESLRLASVAPGILRRAMQDIQVNGYTIPKGWIILVVPAALQLNPNTYEDPLAFNPSRWKDLGTAKSKSFIPFGGGSTQCGGAEFSKVLMATFIHVFVTKYRWTKLKGVEVGRSPALDFGTGFEIKVSERVGVE